ncbi:hypothetical protein AB0F15_16325 [Amycolatopsis sp. NPDC026612]|uniref:hypothetical protein n=1 Tax=Amycolatopsis sp. NPDC026612 TaxID=3155466 RepID=UPI00340B1F33
MLDALAHIEIFGTKATSDLCSNVVDAYEAWKIKATAANTDFAASAKKFEASARSDFDSNDAMGASTPQQGRLWARRRCLSHASVASRSDCLTPLALRSREASSNTQITTENATLEQRVRRFATDNRAIAERPQLTKAGAVPAGLAAFMARRRDWVRLVGDTSLRLMELENSGASQWESAPLRMAAMAGPVRPY